MPRALRVRLEPLRLEGGGDERQSFDGALLRFGKLGPGLSTGELEDPVAAKLTLEMTFMDRVREPTDTEERTLGVINGELSFQDGSTPVFVGTLDDDGNPTGLEVDPAVEEEAPEGAISRRILRLAFGTPDFENAPLTPQEVIVKLDPARFRFFEVRAKLELAGDVEADIDVNDVLDVAITAKNPRPLVEGASIAIHRPLFDEVPPEATLVVTPSVGEKVIFALAEGIDNGDGLLTFVVEDPQPGVLYTAEMSVLPGGPATVLFEDVELNQLVVESEGTAPAPLSTFGSDALVFESPPVEPPVGQAVRPGIEDAEPEQIAELEREAANSALA